MNLPWAMPAGLAMAGIGAVAAAGVLLGNRRRAAEKYQTAEERAQLLLQRRQAWQRRLAVTALAIGCVMMFALAGIAAWLSYGAQREYAHAHNGGDWDAATGFALLLDAGALSLSLIRFFEALTLRSSAITRFLLLGFVSASAAMNRLHAPEDSAASAFLAMIPPLVYAVLLEMLLHKIEQVIMGRQKRRRAGEERGYSLLLWVPWPIGAPVKLWKAWRSELLSTIDNVRAPGSLRPFPTGAGSGAAAPSAASAARSDGRPDAVAEGREGVRDHANDGPGAGEPADGKVAVSEDDDEVRRMRIDLSRLPKGEGPRQLAERIYVAHKVAGLPLDKADLARWAGYTNPRSGGNEYRRLAKEHGPILTVEGAAHVDLDWSSLDRLNPLAVDRADQGRDAVAAHAGRSPADAESVVAALADNDGRVSV